MENINRSQIVMKFDEFVKFSLSFHDPHVY